MCKRCIKSIVHIHTRSAKRKSEFYTSFLHHWNRLFSKLPETPHRVPQLFTQKQNIDHLTLHNIYDTDSQLYAHFEAQLQFRERFQFFVHLYHQRKPGPRTGIIFLF